jgi:hypothetical protein
MITAFSVVAARDQGRVVVRVECAGVQAGEGVGVVQSLASKTVLWERDWYLSRVWCS